jgi:hypothetical protein
VSSSFSEHSSNNGRFLAALSTFTDFCRRGGAVEVGGAGSPESPRGGLVYDRVVISRFDVMYQTPWRDVTVDWSKINLVAKLETDEVGGQ